MTALGINLNNNEQKIKDLKLLKKDLSVLLTNLKLDKFNPAQDILEL